MKKEIIVLLLAGLMCNSVVACGGKEQSDPQTQEDVVTDDNASPSKDSAVADEDNGAESIERDLPDGDYSEIGSGEFFISTSGGTSESGNVPVLFVQDESLIQIGVDTTSFDGSKLSYIYIDGMLSVKEQLGDSQCSLDLAGDSLTPGIHKVEVVQYDGDDPGNEMVTYKSASYEVKSK